MILLFVHIVHAYLSFTGLDDVLSRLEQVEQRPSRALPRLGDTTDTNGDQSDAGEPRRRLRSKKTYKMKRAWGTSDVGRFFVTGPTDVATKPSHFYCRMSQGRVCADSWSPRDFTALPRQQTLSARPTVAVGNARLGSA